MFQSNIGLLTDVNFLFGLRVLFYASFALVPAVLIYILFDIWLEYKRGVWIQTQKHILLEIKVPREIYKSPKAVEFLMNGLFKKGDKEANWWEIYVLGQTRPVSSLEIVSIDGQVHFFVRVVFWLKEIVEAQIYSQYPGTEIYEVPDYTLPVLYDREKGEDGKYTASRLSTQAEQDTITALDRSISKNGFDTGMRIIYIAPKDIFTTSNISGAVGSIMHFSSQNLNGFKASNWTGGKYTFPWQDRKKKKTTLEKKEMLDAYKRREYFFKPYKRKHFVLNTEELATLFHFPGQVSTTPTFTRIESKKAEAPANLPI